MEFHFNIDATFTADTIEAALAAVPAALVDLAVHIRGSQTRTRGTVLSKGEAVGRFSLLPDKMPVR